MTILKPVLSEKSRLSHEKNKIYTFYVTPSSNKFQIKNEFEKMFNVKVKKIRTTKQKPVVHKAKYLQKSPTKIYTKLKKKAFVELAQGQELKNFF
jgi:large subunit ribosomal protein L23